MNDQAEHIKCITDTHEDNKGKSWCRKRISGWAFVDVDHAAQASRAEGRQVACHECIEAIEMALSPGII